MDPHRIDTHHHILPPKYLAEEQERVIGAAPFYAPIMLEWTPQKAVDAMDAAGVATSITSISAPGIWFGDVNQTRRLARECNDYAAEIRQKFKSRFGIFAVLPVPDIDGCLAEIEYVFDTLKADGVGLVTVFDDLYPGDKKLAPIFDELNRRKAVVYFHPTVPGCCTGIVPGMPAPMIEFPFDTTRAVGSLLINGTFARCPDIRWIFSHGGGTLPMLAVRIHDQIGNRKELTEIMPDGALGALRKLYYDVVSVCHPMQFAGLRQLADVSHLLFGSDYPFWQPKFTADALRSLGLSERELAMIERENALGLMPALASTER